jgi:hypothetical protein
VKPFVPDREEHSSALRKTFLMIGCCAATALIGAGLFGLVAMAALTLFFKGSVFVDVLVDWMITVAAWSSIAGLIAGATMGLVMAPKLTDYF